MSTPNLKACLTSVYTFQLLMEVDIVLLPALLKKHLLALATGSQHELCLSSIFLNTPLASSIQPPP